MHARTGDHIVVHGRTINQPSREGTVVEVTEGSSGPRYMVAWIDGTRTLFMPTDGMVTVTPGPAGGATDDVHLECRVNIAVDETGDRCVATASMMTTRGAFHGEGIARCHPGDRMQPVIGEELAIGRALIELGRSLTRAADAAVADDVAEEGHLIAS